MNNNNPYIVVGVGRSGTSTVAGILHNVFEVKMADKFKAPDTSNIDGNWEDMEFRDLNYVRLQGVINREEWMSAVKRLIDKRKEQGIAWGFKDPRTSMYLDDYLDILDNPKIIYCSRDKGKTVDSLKRNYGFDDKFANDLYEKRISLIEKGLEGMDYLQLDFSEKVDPNEVVKKISDSFGIEAKHEIGKASIKPNIYVSFINQDYVRSEHLFTAMNIGFSGLPFKMTAPNLKPASHNRNTEVMKFLETNCTHFLSIDDDVVPNCNPLDYVMSNKKIIGFPARVYQKGEFNWTIYDQHKKEEEFFEAVSIRKLKRDGEHGLVECDVVGSGCILIAREVLEKIKAPFSREWNEDGTQKYGLDFNFCRKAKKIGYKIYSAIDCECEHYKEVGLNKFLDIKNG